MWIEKYLLHLEFLLPMQTLIHFLGRQKPSPLKLFDSDQILESISTMEILLDYWQSPMKS